MFTKRIFDIKIGVCYNYTDYNAGSDRMTDSENKTGLPKENIDSVPAPKENESTSAPAASEEAPKPETPAAPQEAKPAAPEAPKSAKPSGKSASDAKKSADAKGDGLSGVGLAV